MRIIIIFNSKECPVVWSQFIKFHLHYYVTVNVAALDITVVAPCDVPTKHLYLLPLSPAAVAAVVYVAVVELDPVVVLAKLVPSVLTCH